MMMCDAHPQAVPHIVSSARARKSGECYGVTMKMYGLLQHGNRDVSLQCRVAWQRCPPARDNDVWHTTAWQWCMACCRVTMMYGMLWRDSGVWHAAAWQWWYMARYSVTMMMYGMMDVTMMMYGMLRHDNARRLLSIFLHGGRQLLSKALVLYCFSYLLSIFLTRRSTRIETLVYYWFLVFRRIGEYISLDLLYCVNLTSSCLLIQQIFMLIPTRVQFCLLLSTLTSLETLKDACAVCLFFCFLIHWGCRHW